MLVFSIPAKREQKIDIVVQAICCPVSSILSLLGVPVFSGHGSRRPMIQDWRGSFGFRSTSRIKLSRPVSVQLSGPINVEDSSPTTSFGVIALGRNGKVHYRTMYIVDLCFTLLRVIFSFIQRLLCFTRIYFFKDQQRLLLHTLDVILRPF